MTHAALESGSEEAVQRYEGAHGRYQIHTKGLEQSTDECLACVPGPTDTEDGASPAIMVRGVQVVRQLHPVSCMQNACASASTLKLANN
jgi:hypothetical protein